MATARGQQRGGGVTGIHIWLIAFVALWLVSTVLLVWLYTGQTGLVKTAESVALDVMRLIQLAVTREHISAIEVNLSFEVARLLQNRKRGVLHRMETENRRSITILPDPSYGLDQLKMQYYDQRGRQVPIN